MLDNEKLFQTIFDALPSNVAVIDEAGVIVQVNRPWKEYARTRGVGNIKSCCIGANYLEVTHRAVAEGAEGASEAYEGLQKVLKGKEVQFVMDYICTTSEGPEWYTLTAVPVPGNLVLAVHTEISERMRISQLRDEYIAMIAHDLKTPIQGILNSAELSLRNIDQKVELGKRLMRIQRNCRRLSVMIAELSEAAYLSSGNEPSEEDVVLQDLVNKAREIFPESSQARIRLVMPQKPLVVSGDANRLSRVIENIIGNALKFSSPDKPVRVKMKRKNSRVEIQVTDEGIGIEPEDVAHIFERYYRGKNLERREGFGLGLHISRMIVLSHRGTITVESEVGKGSTFHITLPLVGV